MSFINHLKPALIRKGGKELAYDSVLFTNRNKDELIFSGTDNNKSQEPVRITLNGSEVNSPRLERRGIAIGITRDAD